MSSNLTRDTNKRGLIQTDGSRYIHSTNGRKYVRYNFTNASEDICTMLCTACDLLNIHYTIHKRPFVSFKGVNSTGKIKTTITFNKRVDVERLDNIVGLKE